MKNKLSLLLKCSVQLAGICNVLEVLESSFKGTLSAQLHDLHHLQESILKTKQVLIEFFFFVKWSIYIYCFYFDGLPVSYLF
jgi:hypothetical protein